MRLAIDFDNTIRGWKTAQPEKGVKEALEKLKKEGYYISIYSCRTSKEFSKNLKEKEIQRNFIKDFLDDHNIPFDEILIDCDKPIATYYIDDAAIEYKNNWKEITERLIDDI